MERESTMYIIALYLKHNEFTRAKRKKYSTEKWQFYSLVGAVLGVPVPMSTSLAPLNSS